jgi:hypothetical protein
MYTLTGFRNFFSSGLEMKRVRRLPSELDPESDGQLTETQSVDLLLEARTTRRRRRKNGSKSRATSVPREPSKESDVLQKSSRLQQLIYFLIILTGLLHFAVFATLLVRKPEVNFLFYFHGVLSPSTLLLYILAALSGVCGWNALFAKHSRNDEDSAELWFRRYVRMNKYYLIVWFFSTQSTIFGCWKYIFSQNMDSNYQLKEMTTSPKYDYIVRKIVLSLPTLLYNIEIDYGIKATDPPLNMIQFIGIHYIWFLFILSVIPSFMLIVFIWTQHQYYAQRFSDDN